MYSKRRRQRVLRLQKLTRLREQAQARIRDRDRDRDVEDQSTNREEVRKMKMDQQGTVDSDWIEPTEEAARKAGAKFRAEVDALENVEPSKQEDRPVESSEQEHEHEGVEQQVRNSKK